jgi:hypothetical protein
VIDTVVLIVGTLAFAGLIVTLVVSTASDASDCTHDAAAHGAARKPDPDEYPIQSDPRPWDVLGGGR